MKKVLLAAVLATAVAVVVLPAGTSAARRQAKDTLRLNGVFKVLPTAVVCPAGTPSGLECFQFQGQATIPGLGRVSEQYTVTMPPEGFESSLSCALFSITPDVLTVVSKGEIDLSIIVSAACNGFPTGYTVTGGSGAYTGASGSGSFSPNLVHDGAWLDPGSDDHFVDGDDTAHVWVTDTLAGTLAVPNHTFDTTPPVINGAVSKTVLLHGHVARVRIGFKVTARDAIDGPRPVACGPGPGSLFKLGRTKVTCTASDSSGNAATRTFTITVKRASH